MWICIGRRADDTILNLGLAQRVFHTPMFGRQENDVRPIIGYELRVRMNDNSVVCLRQYPANEESKCELNYKQIQANIGDTGCWDFDDSGDLVPVNRIEAQQAAGFENVENPTYDEGIGAVNILGFEGNNEAQDQNSQ